MAVAISAPYPNFFTPDGRPLEGGHVYIGIAGLNPIANAQAAYWDEALTIPAPAEVRTTGGFIVYNGSPARLYTPGDYSILVTDKNGKILYTRLYNTVYDADLFLTEPRGTLSRSMRTPASFNMNLILDGGLYSWTNAGTANFPAGCGAADLFALEVFAGPDGAGIVYQRVVDISLAYATERYSWERKSIDAGATWSTWGYPFHISDATSTATGDTIPIRDADGDIAFRDVAARDVSARDVTAATIIPSGGITENAITVKRKIIPIGAWNMDSDQIIVVAHGLTLSKIRRMSAIIYNDLQTIAYDFYFTAEGYYTSGDQIGITAESVYITLRRPGWFNSSGYSSTGINRGYISIEYEA